MGREMSSSFSRIADGLKLAQAQVMAVAVAGFLPSDNMTVVTECQGHGRRSPLTHRASFHGRGQTPLCSLTPSRPHSHLTVVLLTVVCGCMI